jgi:hypothetical protein
MDWRSSLASGRNTFSTRRGNKERVKVAALETSSVELSVRVNGSE